MRFLPEALDLLTFEQMKVCHAIPVAFNEQKRVVLAVADPDLREALQQLSGRQPGSEMSVGPA
jgi:hypothetical protein